MVNVSAEGRACSKNLPSRRKQVVATTAAAAATPHSHSTLTPSCAGFSSAAGTPDGSTRLAARSKSSSASDGSRWMPSTTRRLGKGRGLGLRVFGRTCSFTHYFVAGRCCFSVSPQTSCAGISHVSASLLWPLRAIGQCCRSHG